MSPRRADTSQYGGEQVATKTGTARNDTLVADCLFPVGLSADTPWL